MWGLGLGFRVRCSEILTLLLTLQFHAWASSVAPNPLTPPPPPETLNPEIPT